MGWIYESIYCTIRAKKWENRGFLYGPLCPIYGAGGVAITAIADFYFCSHGCYIYMVADISCGIFWKHCLRIWHIMGA